MTRFIRPVIVAVLGLLPCATVLAAADLREVVMACEAYHYREALQMLGHLGDAPTTDAQRYRGIVLGKLGRWEEAVQALERASAAAPKDVEVLIDLAAAQGQLALASGLIGKFNGARKTKATLEQAVALAPANVDARNGLFGYYLNVPGLAGGSRSKALDQLAAIERLDAVNGRLARAELAFVEKDYAGAFAIYREVQKSHPHEYRAFYGFGRVAAVTGLEPEAGLASLRHCLSLTAPLRTPGTPGVHLRIGDILQRRGDAAGARAAYEESLRVFPEYPFAREALEKLGHP